MRATGIFSLTLIALISFSGLAEAARPEFEFKKVIHYLSDPEKKKVSSADRMIPFQESFIMWGAVTEEERRARYGDYYTFIWHARRRANLTLRFEYKAQHTRSEIQVQTVDYGNVKGRRKTKIENIGDAFEKNGRVLAWKATLLENGQAVASTKSFLWKD